MTSNPASKLTNHIFTPILKPPSKCRRLWHHLGHRGAGAVEAGLALLIETVGSVEAAGEAIYATLFEAAPSAMAWRSMALTKG